MRTEPRPFPSPAMRGEGGLAKRGRMGAVRPGAAILDCALRQEALIRPAAPATFSRKGGRGEAGGCMRSVLPVTIVVAALIAIWYVAAALMNAPLQRDVFANAGRADYSTRRPRGRGAQHGAPETSCAPSDRRRIGQAVFEIPPISKRSLVFQRADHIAGNVDRLSRSAPRSASAWRSAIVIVQRPRDAR